MTMSTGKPACELTATEGRALLSSGDLTAG